MVAVGGNTSGKGAADDLGEVSLRVPRIASRNDYAAHSVASSVPEASFARLKEPGILMQQRRKHRACQEVFDRAVGHGSSETLSISGRALAIARLAVFCLADACEKSVPGILNVVKRAPRHDLELLPCSEWRNLVCVLQCQKVGEGIKEPILRRAADRAIPVTLLGVLALVALVRVLCLLR